MTKLTRRMLGQAGVLILALVLALGTTVPAFANGEDGLERRGFSGTVSNLDLSDEGIGTIIVQTEEDGVSVTVALTDNTSVRLPSAEIEVQSVSDVDFEVGDRVAILAEVEANDRLTALWILVKPERPQVAHLLGTVITMEDNRVTMVDAQGNAHTVGMPVQALQGLQVGDVATFVVDQTDTDGDDDGDANGEDEDELLVAHGAVTARQIQERVAEHASFLQQRALAGEVPVADAEERIQFLGELMGIIQTHVHGVLTIVKEKVPPQAQAAIERAMERANIGFDMARAAIERAGPPEGIGPPGGVGPSDDTSDNDNDNNDNNGKPPWAGPPGS